MAPDKSEPRGVAADCPTPEDRFHQLSDKVFRLRGIPGEYVEHDVRQLLQATVLRDESQGLVKICSLARDPYRRNMKSATLEFSTLPRSFLNVPSSGEWEIEEKDGVSIVSDCHFRGFTALHTPDDSDWTMDLIAISGLNGHAYGSFKQRGGRFMWLRDALPKDLSCARILVYGYDTSLVNSKSFQNISDLGMCLRKAILDIRKRTNKRLILVGHSLGGIVIKDAIIQMEKISNHQDQSNLAVLCGLLFFGVPNQGMEIKSLIAMAGDQPNRGLLESLRLNSEFLRRQSEEFSRIVGGTLRKCRIINFYETEKYPTALWNKEKNRWEMTGKHTILVGPYSATHGRLEDQGLHEADPIKRAHSELVKFNNQFDEVYSAVLSRLESICDDADGPVHECLRSLYFPQQNHRELDIEYTIGTCQWLLKHTQFRAWLQKTSGLLWIRGKPGSGKSNLIKYAVQNISADHSGAVVASFFLDRRGVDLQKSAVGMYRALLHQLMPCFPDDFSKLVQKFRGNVNSRGEAGKDWNWMERELRDLFISILPKACAKAPVVLFVDALDEAGEDQAISVAERLNILLRSAEELKTSLRICVSCRHYPNIDFDKSHSIIVEDENSADISHFMKEKLNSIPRLKSEERFFLESKLAENGAGIFQWISLILQEAKKMKLRGQGISASDALFQRDPANLDDLYEYVLRDEDNRVETIRLFQWILFAMEPLSLRELRHALPLTGDVLNADLSDYPNSDLYAADEDELKDFISYLSKGLVEVKLYDDRYVVQFLHQSVPDYLLEKGLQVLEGSSKGSARGRGHFQLSRSCLHYLLIREVQFFSEQSARVNPHSLVKYVPLVAYAWRFWRFHIIEAEIEGVDQSDLAAIASSIEDVHVLASRADAVTNLSFYDVERVIDKFWPPPIPDPVTVSFDVMWASWPSEDDPILYFMCLAGVRSAVMEMIRCDDTQLRVKRAITALNSAINGRSEELFLDLAKSRDFGIDKISDEQKEKMVWWAVGRGREASLNILLESGAGVGCVVGDQTTILLAAKLGYANIARTLIGAGVALDCYTSDGESPLHLAANSGHDEVVEVLLKAGADVNDEDWVGDTPLLRAAQNGRSSTAKLLLDAGARVDALTEYGGKPTVEAAVDGNSSLILLLLNAEDEQQVEKTTLATLAACESLGDERLDAMRNLYTVRADLEAKNEYGESALAISSYEGYVEEVQLLLTWGADPNSTDYEGLTPLVHAIAADNLAICQILLADGRTNTEARDVRGRTPLMHAALGEYECVEWDESECQDESEGGEHEGEEGGKNEGIKQEKDVLEMLLQTGRFDVNAQDKTGWSPLALSVQDQNLRKTKILLTHSATNPNIRDRCGRTPLMQVTKVGNAVILQQLLDHERIEPDLLDNNGKSALYFAVRSGNTELVRLLLRTGRVQTNTKPDCLGMTPLLWATIHNDLPTVSLLLETEEFDNKDILGADKEAMRRLRRDIGSELEGGECNILRGRYLSRPAPKIPFLFY